MVASQTAPDITITYSYATAEIILNRVESGIWRPSLMEEGSGKEI